MKIVVGIAIAVMALIAIPMQASALSTTTSSTDGPTINGPFLISGYSFSGHLLRYVQIYNASSSVASLTGWQIITKSAVGTQSYGELEGLVAPKKYVTIAEVSAVPSATFTFQDINTLGEPMMSSITLAVPKDSHFSDESASPSIASSTPKTSSQPAQYYFTRNISSSTGNYLYI